jgi:hypothetical protein
MDKRKQRCLARQRRFVTEVSAAFHVYMRINFFLNPKCTQVGGFNLIEREFF